MKNILIAIVVFIGISGVALASNGWYQVKRLPDGDSQVIYSGPMDEQKLKVVKINDEGTICYISVLAVSGSNFSSGIDCLENGNTD
ncbi:hypothetical protein KC980_04155 [candidate division WWE3 bacterium]|uniref:Uncharacterized protein n=1 Tax=candidate division WWE3 bacterium TaxID=2053526 RepID=A0A955EC92_UNCKA|nr:hypothetical protein [candidate division WWE3 bacterium]